MVDVVTDIESLKQIFQPIDVLSESCELQCSEEGMDIPSINKARVVSVEVNVRESAFDSYESDEINLGLGLEKLVDIIGMSEDTDIAHFHLDRENRYLRLDMENKHFILGLLSSEAVPTPPEIPDVSYPINFTISQDDFTDIIRTADVFADKVIFKVKEGNRSVEAIAKGDIDRINVEGIAELEKGIKGGVECSFSLTYLTDIISVIPSGVEIEIQLAHDRPMYLEYPIIGGEGEVIFHIAPWAES